MSRVYVVNFAGHDFTSAKKWGELVPLTDGYVSLGSPDRVLYDIYTKVAGADPSTDWLLLSGLMILNAFAAASWVHAHGDLSILLWDKKTSDYREIDVSTEQLEGFIP